VAPSPAPGGLPVPDDGRGVLLSRQRTGRSKKVIV
jgi:hypothetical protein